LRPKECIRDGTFAKLPLAIGLVTAVHVFFVELRLHQCTLCPSNLSKAAKHAEDKVKQHGNQIATLQLQERMVRKNDLGAALLSSIDNCPAVRSISETHETEQEAHQDIGDRLIAIGNLHLQKAELANPDKINKAKQRADRKYNKAFTEERELMKAKQQAHHTVKTLKDHLKELERSSGAAPLALTNGDGASSLTLCGFRSTAGNSPYPSDDSDDDDDDDDTSSSLKSSAPSSPSTSASEGHDGAVEEVAASGVHSGATPAPTRATRASKKRQAADESADGTAVKKVAGDAHVE
jgi:hypothetical protein